MFFVSDLAMFPAEPLFRRMVEDGRFEPRLVVIPDFRRVGHAWLDELFRCEGALAESYPERYLHRVRPDANGAWPDVLNGVDLAVYPLPYDISDYHYCIPYSADFPVLPVMVNYGYYRSVYDRRIMRSENYARLWIAFFENEHTLAEYAASSLVRGENAEVVGYVKMDALRQTTAKEGTRPKILLALHHSVPGGMNDELSLATINSRAEFLLGLPRRYPQIDFIFRPHPYLRQTLSQPNVWGRAKTLTYFETMKAYPNVIWGEGSRYFELFEQSDACIHDCGSYLVEYLYTNKPCCYMIKRADVAGQKFSSFGLKCLEQCYLAADNAAIEAFVEQVVLDGRDPKRESRIAFAKQEVMLNYRHAAEIAMDVICAKIKKGN
ncbi:MAG: hypothetical protein MJ240_05300 [Kiritimatiellae bacterium]|nr:hypothetical protein [Kiritimatiellia bacterium]